MRKGTHMSEESREKMRIAHTGERNHMFGKPMAPHVKAALVASNIGKPQTPESNAKRCAASSGKKNPMYGATGEKSPWYGKHHTHEERVKISEALKGKPKSDKHKAKLADASRGKHPSEETRKKLSVANSGENNGFFGKRHTDATRKKLSESHSGNNNWLYGKHLPPETLAKISGKNHYNWQGGISYEPYCPAFDDNLKTRIRSFFENRCVLCGKSNDENGKKLSCHHIEYDKMACCDGKRVQFAALCIGCHSKTNHSRSRWESILHRTIEEIYQGRSYYTKEEFAQRKNENSM